jgi:type I restriction enzyme S subunit
MQDLLTKGIGEDGSIRDPVKHKEAFYATEIGLLPQSWQVKRLKDIAEVERGKFTPRPRNDPRYYGGEFPFVQTGQVVQAQGRLLFNYKQTLNELGKSVSREFPAGTVLVTIAANIGDTAILGVPMCVPDSLVGVQVAPPNDPQFIELCLRRLKPRLLALAPRSAQHNINLTTLRPLRLPIPPPPEQAKIANAYRTAEAVIIAQEEKAARLTTLKKSLMHDLLSGIVRVDTVKSAEQLSLFAAGC